MPDRAENLTDFGWRAPPFATNRSEQSARNADGPRGRRFRYNVTAALPGVNAWPKAEILRRAGNHASLCRANSAVRGRAAMGFLSDEESLSLRLARMSLHIVGSEGEFEPQPELPIEHEDFLLKILREIA